MTCTPERHAEALEKSGDWILQILCDFEYLVGANAPFLAVYRAMKAETLELCYDGGHTDTVSYLSHLDFMVEMYDYHKSGECGFGGDQS